MKDQDLCTFASTIYDYMRDARGKATFVLKESDIQRWGSFQRTGASYFFTSAKRESREKQ